MCNVYRPVGALSAIKLHLQQNNVVGFNSVNELLAFQKNYSDSRQQIISTHEIVISDEKKDLQSEIPELENVIAEKKTLAETHLTQEMETLQQQLNDFPDSSKNVIRKLLNYFRKHSLKRKIQNLENNYHLSLSHQLREPMEKLNHKKDRYEFISSYFNNAVQESARIPLGELERKNKVIEEIKSSIYGAIGEQKVVKELEKLPDDYFLINDFCLSFSPPLYNRKENDYIKSVQIDHLLITPSGIFLIETKNWSDQSLNNISLRSPVEQVKRTNFALYSIIRNEMPDFLSGNKHHWGERKIPIKNCIVLINNKPNEEFEYVKILTLGELVNYIRYFKPGFSSLETQKIADYFIRVAQ